MASMKHEGMVLLFRNRPELAPELLSGVLGVALPKWTQARVESNEFTDMVPTQYHADLVVLLMEGKPCFAIVVEVQLRPDEDKRKSWPLYLVSLHARVKCPTALLVVAPDESVARWCAQPIPLGHPAFTLQPLVLGPGSIPVILDEQVAREHTELAVLSAMAHGKKEVGASIASTVLPVVGGLETKRMALYFDLVVGSLDEAARRAMEAVMEQGTYRYQTQFARRIIKELEEEREEGRFEGERTALLKVLEARGLVVKPRARQRILACSDLAQLERWLHKAVSVRSITELFEPGSPTPRKAAKRR